MDLTEAEDIKKRWQEYTEKLYEKDLHDPDNHNGVITYLEQYEKAKRWTLKDEPPQVSRCPICYWRSVEKNSRKNEGMEPKQKQHPPVDVTGDRSKV